MRAADVEKNETREITAGFWYRNTKKMPRGTYRYTHYHYYPHPYSKKKIQELLNMIEHPVEIRVLTIERPEAAGGSSPLVPAKH